MNNFRELIVWQRSINLVVKIYEITKEFPKEEKFNLVSQMQRAATSIPSNIAEGAGRNTNNFFKHFLTIAIGSSHELETQIIISKQLGYINEDDCGMILTELNSIQKMLYALHNSLQ
ncbi:four helix bundle protein [Nemorincola caseinilytica]|uniref:four helix bundle protein n=1 Tax=Nemorincola caseinilytica TaxID=2054315 RepID=UPI0031F0C739